MKIEQSIFCFSQGPGGHVIVRFSGDAGIVAKFGLVFHETLAITNLLHQLTLLGLETSIQHELCGNKGVIFLPECV